MLEGAPSPNSAIIIATMPDTSDSGRSEEPLASGQSVVSSIRTRIRLGDHLGAYDEVLSALEIAAEDPGLQYLHVLALCNLGCTQDALAHYSAYGLSNRTDEDSLALAGRLLKDRYAAAPPPERAGIARRSGEAYERAAIVTSGYYSAANAATMFRLAGQQTASSRWAAEAIARLNRDSPSTPVERFFHFATRIEAHALLGDKAAAEAALQTFQPLMSSQPHWLARLRSQFRLLERDGGLAFALTERIVPEPIGTLMRGSGRSGVSSTNADISSRVSQAFVLLDCPETAATALKLIDSGIYVHCFFLGPKSDFLKEVEAVHGATGLTLIQECLAKASAESEVSAFVERDSPTAIRYAENLCLGAAAHVASTLGTQVIDLDDVNAIGPQASTHQQPLADAQRFCASVLFADFQAFSKLTFDEVRRFQSAVLLPLGKVLDRQRTPALLRKTWGDAIHAICPDVASGIELALGLQEGCRVDPTDSQRHLHLPLRIALHFGPMEHGYDPIEKQPTIYGAGLTFASRIEPITPPGSVLASEAVVCEAALRCPQQYEFRYAGNLALAKGYGHHRVFTATRSA